MLNIPIAVGVVGCAHVGRYGVGVTGLVARGVDTVGAAKGGLVARESAERGGP